MADTDDHMPPVESSGSDESFARLLERVRNRDEQAAAELVRLYEPHVRRAVRVRLGDPALRRVVDSMDICQSVLANFFVRTAAGEFEIDKPQQLIALLVKMAENKVHDWHRKQTALRRDARRGVRLSATAVPQPDTRDGQFAQRVAEARELLEEVQRRLPNGERRLAAMRQAGHSWLEIAQREGGTPDALRVRLQRALDRIAQELGIHG
jgi:RNA polymerase sigma-70 factor (ECF subfamily)